MMTKSDDADESIGKPWNDRETLIHLYHNQGMSQTDISEELGCARSTVHKAMVRNGVPRRDRLDTVSKNHASFRTDPNGYENWYVYLGGEQTNVRVSHLVAIADGADPYEIFAGEKHVHHENEIRWDNRPENLSAVTPADHNRIHKRGR